MTFIAQDNRRTHPRRAAGMPGRIVTPGEELAGTIENVGEGGVFFSTRELESTADEGSEVVVSFTLRRAGADEHVERRGTVLRAERYFDGAVVVRAFAVKFETPLPMDDVQLA